MEKAIIIRRLNDVTDAAFDYDRIYFGTEFCQWLIPTLDDLIKMRGICDEKGKPLTLLTPWVTDRGIDIVYRLLKRYLQDNENLEVVANDLGMVKLIADEFGEKVTLTAGRLLSNQRRDPRTLAFKDIGNEALWEHYRHSSFDYLPFIDFLKGFNVKRVEIDNLLQGVSVPVETKGVSFSVHYPYNYVTVMRNCPFCYDNDADGDPWQNKKGCMKKCVNAALNLNCDEIKDTLFMKGTAIFIKNDNIDLKGMKIVDRLVYSPYIPV